MLSFQPYNVCVVTLIPGPVKTETANRTIIDDAYKMIKENPVGEKDYCTILLSQFPGTRRIHKRRIH